MSLPHVDQRDNGRTGTRVIPGSAGTNRICLRRLGSSDALTRHSGQTSGGGMWLLMASLFGVQLGHARRYRLHTWVDPMPQPDRMAISQSHSGPVHKSVVTERATRQPWARSDGAGGRQRTEVDVMDTTLLMVGEDPRAGRGAAATHASVAR